MKTINLTKCLCVLLFTLVTSQTVKAEIEMDWVYLNGLCYEIAYDREQPDNSAATIIGRDWREPYWDSETGTYVYPESAIRYEEWNTDSILILPAYVNGVPLRCINEGFCGENDIKNVIIPATVTAINGHAVAHSSLETISFGDDDFLPDEILPISFEGDFYDDYFRNGTFEGCERLTRVDFERPVKQIVPLMFKDCSKLESVGFYSDWLDTDDLMPFDTIGEFAFINCDGLTHFDIPNSVKEIGDGAFFNCSSLQHITLPDSIKVIGNGTFAKCTSLENIHLPEGITSIGDYGFAECNMLENINLQPSLQHIGKGAFLNCWAFTRISFPDAITAIDEYTFCDCHNLTEVNFNNINTFGKSSFSGCNKLTSINLDKAQNIGNSAFTGGNWRYHVYGETYFYTAGEGTWDNGYLGSLKNITLGKDVSFISWCAFAGHDIDTITCMAPIPPAFYKNNWPSFNTYTYNTAILRVPHVVVDTYRNAEGWKDFYNIEGMVIMGNGDVNGDGQTSISDVTALIDVLLSNGNSGSFNPVNADVNGDGRHSISDVSSLIDMLLNANN